MVKLIGRCLIFAFKILQYVAKNEMAGVKEKIILARGSRMTANFCFHVKLSKLSSEGLTGISAMFLQSTNDGDEILKLQRGGAGVR